LLPEEALLVRPFPDLVVLDPLRQLVVTYEPSAGKAANISQDVTQAGAKAFLAAERERLIPIIQKADLEPQ
jgi:hypothetical protein